MIRNTVRSFKNGNTQSTIEHAKKLSSNLGIRCAAGFLRNKGFSVEAALFILTGR